MQRIGLADSVSSTTETLRNTAVGLRGRFQGWGDVLNLVESTVERITNNGTVTKGIVFFRHRVYFIKQ